MAFWLTPANWAPAMMAEEISATFNERASEIPVREQTLESYPDLDTLSALYQPYAVNISGYEPMYLLVGADPEKSKLQLSFKYRFFNPEGTLADRFPWLTQGFHLGYTQTSFWDLRSVSAPMEDINHKPELFFVSPNIKAGRSRLDGLFIQTGLRHESNGRSGETSRSTNYLYISPITVFHHPGKQSSLLLGIKLWTYLSNNGRRNPDLPDYRGYFELESKYGKADGWVLSSTLRWAARGPSVFVDLTYPIHKISGENLDFYFKIEYADALAESLLDYQQRTKALRAGVAIVR